jgi:hypothetical protein
MKTFFCFLFFVVWIIGMMCWANTARGAVTNWPSAQFLMVDQHGNIVPPGYTAGLTEIAAAEAKAEAARQSAELVDQTTSAASNVVNDVVAALTGAYGFAYVTGHTVSFSGAVEFSTNASARIVFCQFGTVGTMTTNAVQHTGHYIWHAYSEAMNTMPAIKYKRNLNGTNAWEFAAYQSTAEFNNTTVNGTLYETVYRSTVWLPSVYNSAFFMAFCEIAGGGQAGGKLDVYEGLSVNGKVGFTGDVTRNGLKFSYQTGLLMAVTNEVAQ